MPVAEKNKKNMNAMDTYAEVARCVSVEPLSKDNKLMITVPMLDLTCLMTHEITINDLIRR